MASLPPPADEPSKTVESGESIAAKGEVNADNQRAKTPAERLGLLDEKSRAKVGKVPRRSRLFRGARRSRARPDRGGAGGDEPRLLRLLSGHGVRRGLPEQAPPSRLPVHLRLRQHPDVVSEPDMWDRAKKIAKAMLDGQLWLPEVGKSTHYHAYWVRPSWVSEMKKMYKTRRAHLLPAAQLGRRQRGAELGHAGADRGNLREARREAKSSAEMDPNRRRRTLAWRGRTPEVHREMRRATLAPFPREAHCRCRTSQLDGSRIDIQRHVEIRRGMRQRAGRGVVDAGRGDRRDRVRA